MVIPFLGTKQNCIMVLLKLVLTACLAVHLLLPIIQEGLHHFDIQSFIEEIVLVFPPEVLLIS
jgi:hypothetical protein